MAILKKALVIGVGPEKGLGASVCVRFAREGFHVFVAGRTAASLELVAAQIRSAGGTATALVTDATKEAEVRALFDQACVAEGSLDVAAYNAGNNTPGAVLEMEADYFELRLGRPEAVRQMGAERLIDRGGLADGYWFLHQQPPRAWSFELDMRSKAEPW